MSRRRRHRRSPLSGLGRTPAVAPHHACIRCFKADTERAFIVQGDCDWLAAAISGFAGLKPEDAKGTARVIYEENGTPLSERRTHLVRLCRGCGNLTQAPLYSMKRIEEGGPLQACVQPDE